MGQGGGMLPRGYPWPPPGFVITQGPPVEPPDPAEWQRCSTCDGHGFNSGKVCKTCRTSGWERVSAVVPQRARV